MEEQRMSTAAGGEPSVSDRDGERSRARNQALIREVNEQVIAFAGTTSDDHVLVVCECADVGCALPVSLTRVEYERIRASPTRFIVKPGHVVPDGERVVEQQADFTVVEKLDEGAAIAARLDPRRDGSHGASQ
jgi:hypothetical protein